MQNIIARSSKMLLMGALLVGSFSMTSFVRAEMATPPSEMQDGVPVYRVGSGSTESLSVYGIKVTNQKDNNFTVAFTVDNKTAASQPGIVYTVSILGKNKDQSVASKYTYTEDVMSLGMKQSMQKEVSYTAPDYLKGTYSVVVNITNVDGASLAISPTMAEVTLNGSGESIAVDGKSCFLSIDGVDGAKYPAQYGIDVNKDETLKAHCSIKNNFAKSVSVTPIFETRYRSAAGRIMGTAKQDVITLTAGQSMDFVATILKPNEPQAYDALLTFADATGKQISDPIDFHYVVQGQGASIQNVATDKSSYNKGETANVTVAWSGSADQFIGARMRNRNADQKLSLDVSLMSVIGDKEVLCVAGSTKVDDIAKNGTMENIQIPVTEDCMSPIVNVFIMDEKGASLAQSRYSLVSAEAALVKQSIADSASASSRNMRAVWYGLGGIGILILLVYLMKRKKTVGMKMLLGLILGASIFVSGGNVKASESVTGIKNIWTIPGQYNQNTLYTSYHAYIDSDIDYNGVIMAGMPMHAGMNVKQDACYNAAGVKVTVAIDGQERVIVDTAAISTGVQGEKIFTPTVGSLYGPVGIVGTTGFTAPTKAGTYELIYSVYQYALNFDAQGACSVYFQSSVNGTKTCGDTNGTTPHLVGKIALEYVVTENRPPSKPTIGGLTSNGGGWYTYLKVNFNQDYPLVFTSTDPDDDTIKYNIYNVAGGPLPAQGYVPSGTSQSLALNFSKTPPGYFYVCAEDSRGLEGECQGVYLYDTTVPATIVAAHAPTMPVVLSATDPTRKSWDGNAYVEVFVNDPAVFTVVSKDDLGHKLKYNYSTGPWAGYGVGNVMSGVVPVSGFVPQGEQQILTTYFDFPGTYLVYVYAQDEQGNISQVEGAWVQVRDGQDWTKYEKCSIQGQTINPGTRNCECPAGQVVSVGANKCVTPTSLTVCPANYMKDATGKCVVDSVLCPTGQVKDAAGACVANPCPTGQVKDAAGACICPNLVESNLVTGAYRCKINQLISPNAVGDCPCTADGKVMPNPITKKCPI